MFEAFCFILRIFEGLGLGAYTTASFAIICSEFGEKAASTFAIIEASVGMGLLIGPTIGGGLYQVFGDVV
ncbi:MFS-type transporter SLC18B1-like Protein [Elysia marginata]|uniref:MFS-type transporter SLC18B1-like Protein n=1 Tax=Elysia marginata TaxID=1093978 RepID=A0AAV4JS26_9GAST|nr:MFS-type transporter SLC18B1-like Protein [Elysia marginata]